MKDRLAWLFFSLLLFAPTLSAQSLSGQISGYVRDASGAIISGVPLEVRQMESGTQYTATTDSHGMYQFLRLPPGHYELAASLQGFQTSQRKNLSLDAGQALSLDLTLQVQGGEQSVTVSGEAAPLDLSSPNSNHSVNLTSIASLPINGRSLDQLALLTPGALPLRAKDRRSTSGFTQTVSANGSRGTAFLLDGTDIRHGVFQSAVPGGVSGLFLGMDSVQEFSVLADAYPAYYGGTGGAVVNVVTRRGTPEFHGSLFEYYRNSAMDARNFFDAQIPPLTRHQFGGAVGGPLPGSGNTFFLSYEGLRERLGATLFSTVPTVAARNGILPGRVITVSSAIKPIVDLYPLPNGPDFGDGTARYSFQQSQPTDDHHLNARTDFNLGQSDRLFVRYTFQNSAKIAPLSVSQQGFDNDLSSRNQYVTLEETHIFSPRLIGTFQLAHNRSVYNSVTLTRPDFAKLPPLIPGRRNLGRYSPSGLSGFGSDTADIFFPTNQFEWGSSFDHGAGKHDVRFGFDWKHYRSNGAFNYFFDGLLSFDNLEGFLTARPSRFQGADAGADANRNFRQNLFALFIDDQYRWKPQLTVNYGLRYEWFTVPTEGRGRVASLRNLAEGPRAGEALFANPSFLNFAPRVGLAWDVRGSNRTVVRVGFGLFYDPIRENLFGYNQTIQPPFVPVLTVTQPPYPGPLSGAIKGKPQSNSLDYGLSTPYVARYHLTLQQALAGDLVLTVGYVGARGIHLPRAGDINVSAPLSTDALGRPYWGTTVAPRRNVNLDVVRYISTDANSVYNALQVGLLRRWAKGMQFGLNYTFGRSIDDASAIRREFTSSVADVPPYYYLRSADRGLSNFHIAHDFVAHYTWDLPVKFAGGAPAILLNDWQVAGIGTFASGYPVTLNNSIDRANNNIRDGQRPDLRPGASNNPVLGGPDRYFDVSAFQLQQPGYLGNLGRNTLIGPGYKSIDFVIARTIRLTEKRRFQFRAEMFNILNHPNFSAPQNSATGGIVLFNNTSGTPVGNAAKIFSTVSTARQLQLGFRFDF